MQVYTIDPRSDDDEDMAPVAKAIGSARIVLMGELERETLMFAETISDAKLVDTTKD